jgi:hypothetical protein
VVELDPLVGHSELAQPLALRGEDWSSVVQRA